MSNSRGNIKNFIRTGQFTRRFNVSKPTDMPDIPEERPLSEHEKKKRESRGSTASNLSTSSTQVGSALGIEMEQNRQNAHTPQPGDLLFIPPDIQTPTSFGPNGAYTAVPSIITYSSGRGASRISIRQASPPKQPKKSKTGLSTITESAQSPEGSHSISGMPPPNYQPPPQDIPTLEPPPDFEPIRPKGSPVEEPRISQISQGSESIRTSVSSTSPSIRTSTMSARDSMRTSIASTQGDDIQSEISSTKTYLITPPGSPPQVRPKHVEMPSSSASWPLAPGSVKSASGISASSLRYTPYYDSPRGSGTTTLPIPIENPQSRFSWHVSNQDRAKNWFTRWFVEWWLLEILSWCFSAICMTVIVVVLLKMDGKELPKWKVGITINAFLSIFSGFAKSALLLPTAEALGQLKWNWFRKEKRMMDFEILDSASRGPWGSFVLLARTKGVTLASVGAAIILLSLPLDLFFQQIVQYPAVWLPLQSPNGTNLTRLSRSVYYNPDPEYVWLEGGRSMGPDFDVNANTLGVLWDHLVMPEVIRDCPSTNCTFEPFWTMAVDASCTPLEQSMLRLGCANTSAEWTPAINFTDYGPRGYSNITQCGWFLDPPGEIPQLMSGYTVTPNGTQGQALVGRAFTLINSVNTSRTFFNESIKYKHIKYPFIDFVSATLAEGVEGAYRNATPVIQECEMHWVVQKRNASIVNGQLKESVLETRLLDTNATGPSYNPAMNYRWRVNMSLILPDIHAENGKESYFGANNITTRKTINAMENLIPSATLAFNPGGSQWLKNHWKNLPPAIVPFTQARNPFMKPDLTPMLKELAESITVIVRRTRNYENQGKRDYVNGIAWQQRTKVDIHWEWITLPAALLGFSLIFLLATVIRSSKQDTQVGIWKTSALAVLFNGLGEDVQENVGQSTRLGQARTKAKELKVKLEDD